jgi:hypothetical protein
VSGARVTLLLRWHDDWPGDEQFDAWLYGVLGHQLEKLKLTAVDEIEITGWERLLEGYEPIEEPG